MFGGIVETIGVITAEKFENGCKHFSIRPELIFDDLKLGDSVSVNGVCLTVTRLHDNSFDCSAVPETLALTNLGQLTKGSSVNLERSLKIDSRIGGHYVQGHVDGRGEIVKIEACGAASLVTIKVPLTLTKYIVKKGYITLDGMSITVVQVEEEQFSVTFIPHTQAVTIVKHYGIGTQLNVEVDILGKYAEKLLGVA
jgi:riboflavin synthase